MANVIAMALNNQNRRQLDEFNKWRKYRGEPEFTHFEWQHSPQNTARYTQNYRPRYDTGLPKRRHLTPMAIPEIPIQSRPISSLTHEQQVFLNEPVSMSFSSGHTAMYRGKKMLGQGGFGRVGMWELEKPPPPGSTIPVRVAIKESKMDVNKRPDSADLADEYSYMKAFRGKGSEHIVKAIYDQKAMGLTGAQAVFNGMTTRVIMEYADLGSIDTLLRRHNNQATPFTERTLWELFTCLVDGITAMKYGGEEAVWDNANNKFMVDAKNHLDAIHFDLKPNNVFLKSNRATHKDTPVAKFGDFGLTELGNWANKTDDLQDATRRKRSKGTKKYYAPEQFTGRFDLVDWDKDPLVGNYSYKMNVFGIGIIMYQLACLSVPPEASRPFIPTFPIKGKTAAGTCYGLNLQAYPYSQALKDCIFSCLYEDPRLRPSLRPNFLELKGRVEFGRLACIAAGGVPDAYDQFLPLEPPNPLPAPVRMTHQVPPPPGRGPLRPPPGYNPNARGFGGGPRGPIPGLPNGGIPVGPIPPKRPRPDIGAPPGMLPPNPPKRPRIAPVDPAQAVGGNLQQLNTQLVLPKKNNVPPPVIPPAPLPPAFGSQNVSLDRDRKVDTTCQFEYQGVKNGRCGNPCRAEKGVIANGDARCRTHPPARFPVGRLSI